MGGNGSGSSSFVAITIVVLLHSLVNIARKEEKENEKKRTNRNKENFFVVGRPSRNGKKRFHFHFNIKRPRG